MIFLIFLLMLPLSSISVTSDPDDQTSVQPGVRATAKWSVFVYVDGDNNLEKFAIEDVNEMETVGSTPEVNIVIQIDRVNGYDKSNDDWKDTRRYLIKKDNDTEIINSLRLDDTSELPQLGEKNMADPKTLQDFLEWGITEFPAEHYLVIMWDHGRGIFRSGGGAPGLFRGFNEDLTSNTQEMKLWELDDVMLDLKEKNGGKKIDIVGFDQCWLGNLETAYELMDSTDYLIASADEEPDKGYNYERPLSALIENPDMEPDTFAKRVTEDYVREYENKTSYAYMTQVTVDLRELNNTFIPLFNDFAELLKSEFYDYQELLFDIRKQIDDYYHPHPDLFHFINLVATNGSLSGELRESASKLMGNYSNIVLAEGHGADHKVAYGLAIYFPHSLKYNQFSNWQKEYDSLIDFSAEAWSEFLHVYHNPLEIVHEELKDTENTKNPYEINAQIRGYKLDLDNVGVYYSNDKINFLYLNMSRDETETGFTAKIPAQKEGTEVYYYIEANDGMGNNIYLPDDAPGLALKELYNFYVGRDYIDPEITHRPLSDKIYSKEAFEVIATVTDNIEVNASKVYLNYRLNDEKDYIQLTMIAYPSNPNMYRAFIPPQLIGTVIYYYFEAADVAKFPNSKRLPVDGDYDFRILGVIINIGRDIFHVDKEADYDNFYETLLAPGYNLTEVEEPLGKSSLTDIDLYVIAEPTKYYTSTEVENLRIFLEGGGDILLIGGNNCSILDGLTDFLGIKWYENDEDLGYTNTFANIPSIFGDIGDLYYERPGLRMEPEKPAAILVDNDLQEATLAAYSYYGQGKLLAFTAGFFRGDGIKISDNTQLLNNLGLWTVKCPIAVPDGKETRINGVIMNNIIHNKIEINEDDFIGFDGTSSVYPQWDEASLNYTWDFDDGEFEYISQPAHKYRAKGTYNVTLTVRTYDGYSDIGYLTIIVNNVVPQSYPGYTKIDALTVYFNGSASTDTPTDLPTLSYFWDFGDGNTGTGIAPEHTYKRRGSYSVILRVTDQDGNFSLNLLEIDLREDDESPLNRYFISIGSIIVVIVFIVLYAMMTGKANREEERRREEERKKEQEMTGNRRVVRKVIKKP